MEVGKVYGLSENGSNKLRQVMKLTVSDGTRVTVVGGKRLCNCGDKTKHANDCGSHYQWMEANDNDASEVLLSAEDIREVQ